MVLLAALGRAKQQNRHIFILGRLGQDQMTAEINVIVLGADPDKCLSQSHITNGPVDPGNILKEIIEVFLLFSVHNFYLKAIFMILGSSSPSAYLQPNIPDSSKTSEAQKQPKEELSETQCRRMPPIALANGVKIIKYACLVSKCQEGFEKWGDARRHMKNVCHVEGKPKISDSAKKASRFPTIKPDYLDPTLESRFSGKLKTDHAPSETELVNLIKEYYSKGPDSENHRKHVMSRVIRPTYGHFKFNKFGFGTFEEFSKHHGLEVYLSGNH